MSEQTEKTAPEPGQKETLEPSPEKTPYQRRFEEAVDNAQYMMIYASGKCPKDIKRDTIRKLITARQRVETGEAIAPEEEADFWLAYQDIWKLVQPATAESIKANLPLEHTFASKLFARVPPLAKWLGERSISKARETVTGYIVLTVLVLIVLLALQIYWVIGNQLSVQLTGLLQKESEINGQINENQKEFTTLELRYKQNEAETFQTTGKYLFYSSPEWERDTLENNVTRTTLEADLESLRSQLGRTSAMLLLWSRPWDRLIADANLIHNDKFASQFEEIDGQIEAIDQQLTADPDGTKAAEAQKSTLEAQLAELDTQLKNSDASQKSILEAKKAAIQRKIELVHQKNDLDALLTDLETKKAAIQGQVADQSDQKSRLEAQVLDLESKEADLQRQIEIKNQDESTLEAQLAGLDLLKQDLQAQINLMDGGINTLNAQLADLQQQLTIADGDQKDKLEADKTDIERRIAQQNEQMSTLDAQLTDLETQKAGIQSQIEQAQNDLKALQANLTNTTLEKDVTLSIIEEYKKQLSAAPGDTNALVDQKSALAAELTDLTANKEAIQRSLEEMIYKQETFAAQLTGIEAVKETVQGQIVSLQSQMENLPSVVDQPELAAKIVAQLNLDKERLIEKRKALELQEQVDSVQEDSRPTQLAGQFVLDILQGYLLPLLYGLLGATASIQRSLSKKIEAVTYSEEVGIQHLLLISLGALAGIMVGWFSFLLPNLSTSFLGSVSPLAIAFFVGYNIEVFFSLMDRALYSITERLKRPSTAQEQQISTPPSETTVTPKPSAASAEAGGS